MRRMWLNFCRDENGATVLEYAWIASLISIAAIAAFDLIETKMAKLVLGGRRQH